MATPALERVVRTIPNFYPYVTGPAKQAHNIARGLEARGIRSPLFTTDYRARDAPRIEALDGAHVTRLRESGGLLAYRVPRGARMLVREHADVVHAHSYRNALADVAYRLARKRGAPFVLQPHGCLLMYRHVVAGLGRAPYVGYDLVTRRRTALKADAVVAATAQERDEAVSFGVAPERVHVIPAGVDVDERPRAPPGSGGAVTLLFVGRICPDRKVENVLRALGALHAQGVRGWRLRVVGSAELRSLWHDAPAYMVALKRLAERLGIRDAVEFTGELRGEALAAAYRTADLFVYTSAYENFGQTILEAAAHGLPVVATPVGVARDIVAEAKTGHLVPHGDVPALAGRLAVLVEDRERMAAMGEAMLKTVRNGYDWPGIVDRYVALYAQLQAQPRHAA